MGANSSSSFNIRMQPKYWKENRHKDVRRFDSDLEKAQKKWISDPPTSIGGIYVQAGACDSLEDVINEIDNNLDSENRAHTNTIGVIRDYREEISAKREELKQCADDLVERKYNIDASFNLKNAGLLDDPEFDWFAGYNDFLDQLGFLKRVDEKGFKQRQEDAEITYQQYIHEDSPNLVNVEKVRYRNPLHKQANDGEYEEMNFEPAYEQVQTMIILGQVGLFCDHLKTELNNRIDIHNL